MFHSFNISGSVNDHFAVEGIQCNMCQSSKFAKVMAESGHLASIVSEEHSSGHGSGCGSAICPWLIQVRPGQKINLTLYDFANEGSSTIFRFVYIAHGSSTSLLKH